MKAAQGSKLAKGIAQNISSAKPPTKNVAPMSLGAFARISVYIRDQHRCFSVMANHHSLVTLRAFALESLYPVAPDSLETTIQA